MRHLLRPYTKIGLVILLASAPLVLHAQVASIAKVLGQFHPLLQRNSSQGYLGVEITDIDNEKSQSLKLKEAHGALITLIDHDAPAGQIGLKVNDVVLSINGQTVEGAEQLRRMLREIPAGHKVTLLISRDGNTQTLAVQLADRRAMEHDVWNKINSGNDMFLSSPAMGMMAGGGTGDAPSGSGFHMPFFGSSLHIGALVEPLTSQMAEYLGVPSGLMVKEVAHKSEAENAGLKAFDVILKIGGSNIATIADWDRSLRANQGKSIQVTILRDKKQQSVTLQVEAKRRGEVETFEFFNDGKPFEVAAINPQQMEALQKQVQEIQKKFSAEKFAVDQKQIDKITKQAQEMAKDIQMRQNGFQFDQKQMDIFQKKMEEFQKNFHSKDFQFDSGNIVIFSGPGGII